MGDEGAQVVYHQERISMVSVVVEDVMLMAVSLAEEVMNFLEEEGYQDVLLMMAFLHVQTLNRILKGKKLLNVNIHAHLILPFF